ncbi:MAG: CBS domain-containing protein [Rhodospirillales bacterium]
MNVDTILRNKGAGVLTIPPDATIAEAVRRLDDNRVGALVVSADGRAIGGILSERDIVRGLAAHGTAALDRSVSALMSRDVRTCQRDDTLDELFALMTDRRVRHLPVVEDGALAGIVSIGDVVKAQLDALAGEAEALREYIAQA